MHHVSPVSLKPLTALPVLKEVHLKGTIPASSIFITKSLHHTPVLVSIFSCDAYS